MPERVIRAFTTQDIPRVLALWRETEGMGKGPGDTPEGVARFLERNPNLSWIAETGDVLAGAILCGHDGRRGQLYHLAVAPAYRRQGIASDLVERSLAGLRALGIERCLLSVLVDNVGAVDFYASLGARLRSELRLLSFDIRTDGPLLR